MQMRKPEVRSTKGYLQKLFYNIFIMNCSTLMLKDIFIFCISKSSSLIQLKRLHNKMRFVLQTVVFHFCECGP